jgi:hypothetical protein
VAAGSLQGFRFEPLTVELGRFAAAEVDDARRAKLEEPPASGYIDVASA